MGEAVLRVRGLSKAFGPKVVLDDVSFEVGGGEILGVMGPSGTGKSILLKAIIGLTKPDRGEVWFRGHELTRLTEHELSRVRAKIGYVFQEGALFDSMTIEENLSYPLRRHTSLSDDQIHQQVNQRLAAVGLSGTNGRYPSEISGGMGRRVGLLRATMLDPHIVLFDEPTSGLDPITVQRFVSQVSHVRRSSGVSGIFVTHDSAAARALCDRVAFLSDGRLRFVRVADIDRSNDPLVRAFFQTCYVTEENEQAA